jgi:hypothetical protein
MTSSATIITPAGAKERKALAFIPPLENGDRLSREEFERRYEAMPRLKKAELIEGVVYIMSSPVNTDFHAQPHFDLTTFLGVYRIATPGIGGGDNSTLRLDLDNEPQPDVLLYIDPKCGGKIRKEEGYIVGGPELVAEIAASSVSYDLGSKLQVYRRNAVREYVVWRVLDKAIDWFVLRGSQFDRLACNDGIYRSEIFPGLWLDAEALIRGDLTRVHQILQQGIASPDHQEFVSRLRQAVIE